MTLETRPQTTSSRIAEALAAAGVSCSGVSEPAATTVTSTPASFIEVGGGLVQIDWSAAPAPETVTAAVDVLRALGLGEIGAITTSEGLQ